MRGDAAADRIAGRARISVMDSGTLILIEMLLSFGLLLGFAARELWALRRDRPPPPVEDPGRAAPGMGYDPAARRRGTDGKACAKRS